MYAVIRTGGKQYRVKPGDVIVVERLDGEPGAKVAFEEVLLLGQGDAVTVGAPLVAGASVDATLIETRRGDKIKVFKKIRRQGYRRTRGHRQTETVLRVTAVAGAGESEAWTGEVDLTPRSELRLRARNLATRTHLAEARDDAEAAFEAEPPVSEAKAAPKAKTEAKAKAKAAPKAKTEAKAKAAPKVKAAKPAAEKTKKPAAKKPAAKSKDA